MLYPDGMSLGKRIKRAREACGLRQEDVADHFKTSKQAVSQWERDTTRPDLDRIAELAGLFKVSCNFLLTAEREPDDLDRLIAHLEGLQGQDRKGAAALIPKANDGPPAPKRRARKTAA